MRSATRFPVREYSRPHNQAGRAAEFWKLMLLVLSAAVVACAGSIAGAHPSSDLGFAKTEITKSEGLLSDLTERVANETEPKTAIKIGRELTTLDQRIVECRQSLARAGRQSKSALAQENLRASVMILSEAATRALNAALDADSKTAGRPISEAEQVTSSK